MATKKKNVTEAPAPEAPQETPQSAQETPEVPEVLEPTPEGEAPQEPQEAPQEGHLDPAQLESMEDGDLHRLAQDLGLDPAAYEDRAALIAAMAEVPVIPGPPEPEPEPITAETPFPCEATITASLAVLRRTIGPGTADMLKPVATLKRGTRVHLIGYRDGNAQLANGLWTNAENLTR